MKKLVLLIFIIGLAIYAYYHLEEDLTPQEREVNALEEKFETAKQQLSQAEHSASMGGIDTTSSAAAAVEIVKKISEELYILMEHLTEEEAIKRAEKLESQIKSWLSLNG